MSKFHDNAYSSMAKKFCRGSGLEIGCLHTRLNVDANVRIVDFQDTETLRKNYKDDPNVNIDDIWPVDIVTNAWDLSKVSDNSVDFVMSSHVLEHLPNPGTAIKEWLRVVKPGGIVFFIVPDMRYTFDSKRKLTPVSMLIEKYNLKTDKVPYEAYEEFVTMVDSHTNKSKEYITGAYENQDNIHVHTFTEDSIIEFCNIIKDIMGFKIIEHKKPDMHINVALMKV